MTHEPSDEPTPAPADGATRSIELEIEVPGIPEEVWNAIATGPGISSWYVPHEVEEREGGDVHLSFGPGMDVTGRVAAWEPPRRVMFDGQDITGLAFEWFVEARDGGSCVVRLVNSGFGTGGDWDDQYDAMTNGWRIFLLNLRLHLEHFAGEVATPSVPMAMSRGDSMEIWPQLLADLGVADSVAEGDRVVIGAADSPTIAGRVAHTGVGHIAVVVDEPARGTAFLTAEQMGDTVSVSLWSYLYGADGNDAVERDEPRWRAWLEARADPSSPT